MSRVRIAGDRLVAEIDEVGAELSSLRRRTDDGDWRELLWQASRPWPWHAPLLFPVIGRLGGDRLVHEGTDHPMPKHGFARDELFHVGRLDTAAALLSLSDSESTRHHFPFSFRLTAAFTVEGGRLRIEYRVENPGPERLSASLGFHPGFRRPLPGAASKADHRVVFERSEPAPIRRVGNDLLLPGSSPTPVRGRELPLREELFADGAVVFDALRSTALTYGAPGAPELRLSWRGFEQLALWSPPGAELLCIEPWCGLPSPAGYDGPYEREPGRFRLAPGASRVFTLELAVRG
ncbi:aldose 1-epimerase family protein [Streptomyces sp. NPDC091217]|uniref:aldose 1-epimerase family protein n=1 Tax=Streptomyces sp. NPDC091217 TaxID=3365975 RepID=UPI0037FE72F3